MCINVQASPLHVWHLSPEFQFWTGSKLLINCFLPHLHLRVGSQWVWICVYVVRQKRSPSSTASGENPSLHYCQAQITSHSLAAVLFLSKLRFVNRVQESCFRLICKTPLSLPMTEQLQCSSSTCSATKAKESVWQAEIGVRREGGNLKVDT